MPEEYGGQGLSQTGYARVFEAIAKIDTTLSVVLGVHQSIGYKGIAIFGSDEQKERWLPDLATGRKLAAFALTEPSAGSDAWNVQSRAVRQADGSYVLNGGKRYIGNGSRADVLTTFARCEVDGKDRHIALLVEKGMKGFEVGDRYDTMGLRANDLRQLRFNDVRIPPENVLGEPGEGFRIAMAILNNGRIGLGTGSVGGAKMLIDMVLAHVTEREQFGAPLADLELVQEKIGWMVSYLFGLESMCYLTTGLVDRGVEDYSLESAICKISGTEFLWYQANRALQLAGGEGYMRTEPLREDPARHPHLPDLRGRQRRAALVRRAERDEAASARSCRAWATSGSAIRSARSACWPTTSAPRHRGRTRSRRRDKSLQRHSDSVAEQVGRLRSTSEKLLKEHRKESSARACTTGACPTRWPTSTRRSRSSHASRALFAEQGVEASGQERHIARASARAPSAACTATSTRSRTTTTSTSRRSPSSPTAAARTATRCAVTEHGPRYSPAACPRFAGSCPRS